MNEKTQGAEAKNRLRDSRSAVDLAIGRIEKSFGSGSAMRLGQRRRLPSVDRIPTNILSIDHALGIGGMPRGRVIEIFGLEGAGKSTLALQVVAEAQKSGGAAAVIDAEHALDALYAQRLGVDLEDLVVSQPDSGEQALEIAEVLIRSGGLDIVVVDSVAALVPKLEIAGEVGEAQLGLQARLMSQALRKLTGIVAKSKTCLIFINQLQEKAGVMSGNPDTATGGRALKFYASVRIEIRRLGLIKNGEDVIGARTRLKVVKNKVAPPFREAEFDIFYGQGISREADLLDLAVDRGIVERAGVVYSFGSVRLGQGRTAALRSLQERPERAWAIEQRLRADLGLGPGVAKVTAQVSVPSEDEDGRRDVARLAAAVGNLLVAFGYAEDPEPKTDRATGSDE